MSNSIWNTRDPWNGGLGETIVTFAVVGCLFCLVIFGTKLEAPKELQTSKCIEGVVHVKQQDYWKVTADKCIPSTNNK